jgi:hypothetical protein
MINKDEMMSPILEGCPSFRAEWDTFVDEWKDEKDGLPIYLSLSSLARHLISMLEVGQTEAFPEIFEIVERWHIEGDEYVREAATVGLLEDLQNTNLHKKTSPEQFRCYLGTESLKWWDKLYGFWERGEMLRP